MNYNSIILCGYICVTLSVDSSQRNTFVQFIKAIKVHEQNSTCWLLAARVGHAVMLSAVFMGNLKHDIFAKVRQPLSSSHQKHPYSASLSR